MACSVSSTVEPVATQPGKSGTYAEKLAPASSITIAYFIGESLILQASLFKDTVEGSRCQVVRRLSRNSYTAKLARMLVLSMTSATGNFVPTVFPQHSKYCSDFHSPRLAGRWLIRLCANLGHLPPNGLADCRQVNEISSDFRLSTASIYVESGMTLIFICRDETWPQSGVS